ncbi:MAG: hypothetical protein ACREPW_14050, partial [Candidatus Binataceae bacterium]
MRTIAFMPAWPKTDPNHIAVGRAIDFIAGPITPVETRVLMPKKKPIDAATPANASGYCLMNRIGSS